jgi:sugar lactone lactonase YvrE
MKKILPYLSIGLLLLLAYLLLWPIPLDPQAWSPPEPPPLSEGIFQQNQRLLATEQFDTEPFGTGPEDVALDEYGRIYVGLLNGTILRYQPDGTRPEAFAETNGRPLGLAFDQTGQLIVADATQGLLSINAAGAVSRLTHEVNGEPIHFADDVDIAADGIIYFSDASTRFGVHNYRDDILEHRGYGRLLSYDPASGKTSVLLDDLYFANGVAVSHDQQAVLLVETSKYRVRKYWLSGPKKGKADVLIDNLPGFPDGVSRGSDGLYWVAVPNPRNALLDQLLPRPFLRKLIYRLPEAVQPQPIRYGMVLGINEAGEVVHNLQDPSGTVAFITSVEENAGFLYFGSLTQAQVGRFRWK